MFYDLYIEWKTFDSISRLVYMFLPFCEKCIWWWKWKVPSKQISELMPRRRGIISIQYDDAILYESSFTWTEFKIEKIYWKAMTSSLTDKSPKSQVTPKTGTRIQIDLTPALKSHRAKWISVSMIFGIVRLSWSDDMVFWGQGIHVKYRFDEKLDQWIFKLFSTILEIITAELQTRWRSLLC